MSEHQKALDKAKIELMRQPDSAFFIHLCFSMDHRFDTSIPTACTDGMRILYNPDFFMSLTREEQVFLLLHETLHVALQHILRIGDRDLRKWNIAGDYVINYMLVSRGFKMPKGGLYEAKYDDSWTTSEVYADLPENPKEDLPMADVQAPGSGSPTEGEESSGGGATTPEEVRAELADKIDRALMQAEMQAQMAKDKSAGNVPGQIKFYIDSLKSPKLPWHRILRQFMTKAIKRGYTWKRPNRRFIPKHYLPSRNSEALCDIAVVIDTSCSVTDDEFHQFVSETYEILKVQRPTSLTLIQFDTRIRSIEPIHTPRDLMKTEFTGRGGTAIAEVLEWVQANKPAVTLVFTDGVFYMPNRKPKTPLVWLINNNPGFTAPWGKVIHYDL